MTKLRLIAAATVCLLAAIVAWVLLPRAETPTALAPIVVTRSAEHAPPALHPFHFMGCVVDREGKPLPDASIFATREGHDAAPALLVKSGDDGHFRIDMPVNFGERVSLRASKSGLLDSPLRRVKTGDGNDTQRLYFVLNPTINLTGHVTSQARQPLKAVEVIAEQFDENGKLCTVSRQTDADGQYTFETLLPGLAWVRAKSVGLVEEKEPVLLRSGGELQCNFVLTPPFSLRGRVVRAGQPVGQFVLLLQHSDDVAAKRERAWYRWLSPDNDTDGRFSVEGLSSGGYTLTAFSAGGAAVATQTLDVLSGQKDCTVEIQSSEALKVSVVDPTNHPLGGVQIQALPYGIPREDLARSPLPDFLRGVSDSQGVWRGNIPAGIYTLGMVRDGKDAGTTLQAVRADNREVTLHAEPALRCEVNLWDYGLKVTLMDKDSAPLCERTAADGLAETPLANEGLQRVVVTESTETRHVEHTYVVALRGNSIVNLDPPDAGETRYRIAGKVTAGGKEVVDAFVHLRQNRPSEMTSDYIVKTTEGGAFEVGGVAAGWAILSISTSSDMVVRETPDYSEIVTIDRDLDLPIALHGAKLTVTAGVAAGPAPDVMLLLFRTEDGRELSATATTDKTGHIEIPNLKPGHYAVEVGGAKYAPQLISNLELTAEETHPLKLELMQGENLKGVLQDNGEAKSGAILHLVDAQTGWVYLSKNGQTDAKGEFSIPNVSNGKWAVVATLGSAEHTSQTFSLPLLRADGTAGSRVVLQW